MRYKDIPQTAAMKHGLSMEFHAKRIYLSLNNRKHKNMKSAEAGLVTMKDFPFIAAFPVLFIDCDSCGKGLLEIKCPFSKRSAKPSANNLSYLKQNENKIH